MPLFGSHKKDHVATDNVHGTTNHSGVTNTHASPMSGNGAGTGTSHLSGVAPQGQNAMSSNDPNYAYQGAGTNTHTGQPGLMNDPSTNQAGVGTNTHTGQHTGQPGLMSDPYANQAGVGTNHGAGHHQAGMAGGMTGGNTGMNTTTGSGLPPAGTLNNSNQTRGGHSMTGKVEHAVGSLVGSSALKAKGLQKEQEAASIKLQTQEIAEAERLEREALLRRERAVAHGAHPDNSALGSSGQHGAMH